MKTVRELKKERWMKKQKRRRFITISMVLTILFVGMFMYLNKGVDEVLAANGETSLKVNNTETSIQEYVAPFQDGKFSDGGKSADGSEHVIVFYGHTKQEYKGVKIIFTIKNNKVDINDILVDGEKYNDINKAYALYR